MGKIKILTALILLLVSGIATTGYASATASGGFHEINDELFDDWDICRTRAAGEDGFYQITKTSFRPAIVFESLGKEAALASRLGEQFVAKYPDPLQRAEMIFSYVRNKVRYTPDIDQFEFKEFAQNADELVVAIDRNGFSYGDCEDSAILLAVMYKAAGYRTAIAVTSGHTAAMVYLPDYRKASVTFEIEGEPGWLWMEATGKTNPFGWAPKEVTGVKLATYEIGNEAVAQTSPATAPSVAVSQGGSGGGFALPFPFFGVISMLWFMSLFRRRRTR